MSINLRSRHTLMTQQILHREDVITILLQMRRERMPQRMTRRRLG